MVLAAGCLTVNDAICKLAMPRMGVGQIIAIRSVVVLGLIAIAVIAFRPVANQLVFRNRRLHIVRGCLFAGSAVLFLSGLARMPLTNAIALTFLSPVFVAALAAPLLKETVSRTAWFAVAAGFFGAVLILQPSIRGFGWASVFPVGAALLTAVTDLLTRRMADNETSAALVTSSGIGALVVGVCLALGEESMLEWEPLLIVGVAGLMIFLAYYFMVEAFRRAPAHYVSSFRYSSLIWGMLVAFVVWDQLPDLVVLLGGIVLAASGYYLNATHRINAG